MAVRLPSSAAVVFGLSAILLTSAAALAQNHADQKPPQAPVKTSAAKAAAAKDPAASTAKPAATALTEHQRVLHAINRLTFGATPGQVDAVTAKGLDAWIEDQLHPESVDDSALNARLGPYATTRMNPKDLALNFPSDGVVRQIMMGRRVMPADADLKLVYSVDAARLRQQIANQGQPPPPAPPSANGGSPPAPTPAEEQARTIADHLLALPKNQRLAALEEAPPEQLVNFVNTIRADQRDRLMADATPKEIEILRALTNPMGLVAFELQQTKALRDIYSERHLLEVMTDFWFNHFNIFQFKNQDAYYTTTYERDVIRPHALGKFYDLLLATAQSPAMLMYLDNWLSIGPHSQAAGKNGQSGLNENYAREVMELHTLGVDGGYTQEDVTELARVLTGWTIADPDDAPQFKFDPARHEPGTKTVLGETLYETGYDEGLRALNILAHHPSTARFISRSIAERFVSDDPPESLVARMAAKFIASDGDIREVLRAMIQSPEFWSPDIYRTKFKTPLEFVVSAVRASGADVTVPTALVQNLNAMGMQPYGMVPPTGYSTKAVTWENSSALLARLNFSSQLTQGKLPGVRFDPADLLAATILTNSGLSDVRPALAKSRSSLDFVIALTGNSIFGSDLSPALAGVIHHEIENPEVEKQAETSPVAAMRIAAGFMLGSPDFQRH